MVERFSIPWVSTTSLFSLTCNPWCRTSRRTPMIMESPPRRGLMLTHHSMSPCRVAPVYDQGGEILHYVTSLSEVAVVAVVRRACNDIASKCGSSHIQDKGRHGASRECSGSAAL